MTKRLVLLIAILFGLITAFLIFNFLTNATKTADTTEYVDIVIAKDNISQKTVLTANMLSTKKIPVQYKHSRELTDTKDAIGKVALVPINAGQSIHGNHIIRPGESNEGLAYKIPEGKRAMSVAIDEVSGVSGLIKPGDRVDIISNITIEDPKDDRKQIPFTLVVLQDIEVLSVGKILETKVGDGGPNITEARTITLAVTIEESLPLKSVSERGSISLLLRSPIDDSKSGPSPFIPQLFIRH